MQAIMETLFDAVYLVSVITIGILMIQKCQGEKQYRLFGIMAVVLGFGDAFISFPELTPFVPQDWSTLQLP